MQYMHASLFALSICFARRAVAALLEDNSRFMHVVCRPCCLRLDWNYAQWGLTAKWRKSTYMVTVSRYLSSWWAHSFVANKFSFFFSDDFPFLAKKRKPTFSGVRNVVRTMYFHSLKCISQAWKSITIDDFDHTLIVAFQENANLNASRYILT